ncbi:hypothetical protein [Echinicola vietnamensis]|uniref:Uncharacterized protein n=1 Tax=Echinicola vietnamensis (strain DSM 17526 / LMG 23754 / KMM 6221) TaxID=926556 RepID=L0FV25_ECHVK|nr:hypothetical protein [Echinicola vietnamensis]AGA77754.1 hypothetical protein Echvi_1488 [Echinicola vietnamensis DSM 17526]
MQFISSKIIVFFACVFLLSLTSSCHEDQLMDEVLVYENDFSAPASLSGIENGKLMVFEEDTVLGNYNNEEVSVAVNGMPGHNTVRVVIELLVHDSWDGNNTGVSGPDYWFMEVSGVQILNTTFSNSPCVSSYCLFQSYPDPYGRHNDPKTGALETDLPGLCQYADTPNWTTKYRISKLVSHNGPTLTITCGDQLLQENAPDPICDESWSISKIEVSALTVK